MVVYLTNMLWPSFSLQLFTLKLYAYITVYILEGLIKGYKWAIVCIHQCDFTYYISVSICFITFSYVFHFNCIACFLNTSDIFFSNTRIAIRGLMQLGETTHYRDELLCFKKLFQSLNNKYHISTISKYCLKIIYFSKQRMYKNYIQKYLYNILCVLVSLGIMPSFMWESNVSELSSPT